MPERDLTFDNEVGLHARPAALFVKKAGEFDATITLHKAETEADARSLLAVLKLDVRRGDHVRVTAEGDDAEAALDALTELTGQL
ncbi:MAG: HPr family phosphocarrier protein [Nitriliruptor sp.]|uniref:HPr family phosphocarrier protein n=1 Tax=Nitriliruptor sp. TaxID=2448056 RepID=UPI0034A05575